MSSFRSISNRALKMIHEDDAQRPVIGLIEADQCVRDTYNLEMARMPGVALETLSGLTLTAGSDRFTLSTASVYRGEIRIRLQVNGLFLSRISRDELDGLRRGTLAVNQGRPQFWCAWEESDLEIQGRTWPGSDQAYVCDIFTRTLPADPGVAADLDALVLVGLSAAGESALVHLIAADLGGRIPQQEMQARGLTEKKLAAWLKAGRVGLYAEEMRQAAVGSINYVQRRQS